MESMPFIVGQPELTGCPRCDGLRQLKRKPLFCLRHDPKIPPEWRRLNGVPLEPLPAKAVKPETKTDMYRFLKGSTNVEQGSVRKSEGGSDVPVRDETFDEI
jgi:hypothetical protein